MTIRSSRAGRLLVAGVVLGVGVLGGAAAVMAVDGANQDQAPAPTTTEVAVSDSPAAVPSSSAAPQADAAPAAADPVPAAPVADVAPAPTESTLAKGFESYQPGDALPAAPAAPASDADPVQTVAGPNGPIYPDGYVAPEYRTPDQGGTATAPPPIDQVVKQPIPAQDTQPPESGKG